MHEEERNQEQVSSYQEVTTPATLFTSAQLSPSWRTISDINDRVEAWLSAYPRMVKVGLALAALLLFAAYVRLSLLNPKNSDDAVVVLQAQDILHGNVLLKGWVNGPDSFFSILLPLYVVGGLLAPHMAVLMYIVPAITYVLIVALCAAITWTWTEARHRLVSTVFVTILIAALPAVGALPSPFPDIGPPIQTGGDHKTTLLFLLMTFYLLSTSRKLWLASVPLILAAVGDPMAVWIGIPAVGLAGLVLIDRGQTRDGMRLLLFTIACLLAAKLIIAAIPMLGGFDTTPGDLRNTFVRLDDLPRNLRLFFESMLVLFGAEPFGLEPAYLETAIVIVRLMVLLCLTWVVWRMVKSAAREADTLKLLLLSALILNSMAFVFSTTPTSVGSSRYLPTLTIFAPLLAGLCWYEVGIRATHLWIATPIVAVAFLIPFGRHMLEPIPQPPLEAIKFLETNHFSEGYGSYWSADIFTVLSDGKLTVRPVAAGPERKLVPFEWQAARQWYGMNDARFLIFDGEAFGASEFSVINTWGYPIDRKVIDGYTILSWQTPLHLAPGAVVPH